MAARNSVKTYVKDCFYHLYNRGVEKRTIFQDEQDFGVFCNYLKNYLLPKDEFELQRIIGSQDSKSSEKQKALKQLHLRNFNNKIELHAYALLPNHFHLLVRQNNEDEIFNFMIALGTRYSGYFNRKYKRVGPLFQGVYKAVLIETDMQLLHLSRYIHLNPIRYSNNLLPSSLNDYLGTTNTAWIKTDYILNYFRKDDPHTDYQKFVSSALDESQLGTLTIEYDG
ncbi:MAG: transposase [bacterium]|nr:transposase [bacterium]